MSMVSDLSNVSKSYLNGIVIAESGSAYDSTLLLVSAILTAKSRLNLVSQEV